MFLGLSSIQVILTTDIFIFLNLIFQLPSSSCSKADANILHGYFSLFHRFYYLWDPCTWPKFWQFCLFRYTSLFQLSFQSNNQQLCFKVLRFYLLPFSDKYLKFLDRALFTLFQYRWQINKFFIVEFTDLLQKPIVYEWILSIM